MSAIFPDQRCSKQIERAHHNRGHRRRQCGRCALPRCDLDDSTNSGFVGCVTIRPDSQFECRSVLECDCTLCDLEHRIADDCHGLVADDCQQGSLADIAAILVHCWSCCSPLSRQSLLLEVFRSNSLIDSHHRWDWKALVRRCKLSDLCRPEYRKTEFSKKTCVCSWHR